GLSATGREVSNYLLKNKYQVVGIIDKSMNEHSYRGISIYKNLSLLKNNFDKIIISSMGHQEKIASILLKKAVPKEKIIKYYDERSFNRYFS
ncbi:MAG: hypothetical protein AB1765_12100, partial [Candidatus Hydrogenedentota bacterium]